MTEHANDESQTKLPIKELLLSVVAIAVTVIFYFLRHDEANPDGGWLIELGYVLSASALIAIVIWQACDPFADAAQWVGHRMRLPSSVRGATLDAVASSLPELFTGIFFVVVALSGSGDSIAKLKAELAEGYGSTIATCAGSSIYNMVLIPAICAIAISFSRPSRPAIEVPPEVVRRDGMWVMASQLGLLIFLFQPKLHWWMAVVALLAYAGYVFHQYWATRKFRSQLADGSLQAEAPDDTASVFFGMFEVTLNGVTATLVLLIATLVAAVSCYFLVEITNESAVNLGVPAFFVAVILTAAVSSIPDTFLSLGSARRGDDEGAITNVFGSNIFDICIGMSIPLLVSCYLNDWNAITLEGRDGETLSGVVGLRVFLFFLTGIVMFFMWKRRQVTRTMGYWFCALYLIFIVFSVLGALDIIAM